MQGVTLKYEHQTQKTDFDLISRKTLKFVKNTSLRVVFSSLLSMFRNVAKEMWSPEERELKIQSGAEYF